MTDLKNDSVFVLRVVMIIAGFIMFCYSKIGTYILIQIGVIGYCLYEHYTQGLPFLRFFVTWALIISVLFEIIYPILYRYTQFDFLEMKEEFDNAKNELKRRRTDVNNEQ